MSTSPRHQTVSNKAERRRIQILEAAIRIVRDGGVDSVTVRSVAAEAKVPLGSLTYYFESREELITLALRHYMREIEQRVEKLAHDRLGHLDDDALTIDTILDVLVETDVAQDMCVVEYEMIVYAARKEELMREVRTYRLGFESQLAGALEKVGVPKPILGARLMLNVVDGFDVERMIRPEDRATDLRQRLELATFGWHTAKSGRFATS